MSKKIQNLNGVALAAGLTINNTDDSIQGLIARVLGNYVVPILMALAVGAVIYTGVLFITSSGDPQKLAVAKKSLLYVVLGILLIAFCWLIVVSLNKIVKGFF